MDISLTLVSCSLRFIYGVMDCSLAAAINLYQDVCLNPVRMHR
jgi:hypothetical protein